MIKGHSLGEPMVFCSSSRCATGRYFQVIGSIHDIESYFGLDNAFSLDVQIFLGHWGHLSIILWWLAANLFHLGWNANYQLLIKNPIQTSGIAHAIWDPHAGFLMSQKVYSAFKTSAHAVVLSYSGIYNWLYTVGFSSVNEIYNFVIQLELLAVISILLAKLHLLLNEELLLGLKSYTSMMPHISAIPMANGYYHSSGARLNYHTGVLVGFTSILWFCHFHYHAIPVARQSATPNILASLTFLGGLKSDTQSLYLTDIAHHHLACGVLFVWAGHLYSSSLKAFGHRMRDVLFISTTTLPAQSTGSANQSLALALASCSVITSVVAQHIYSLKPYFDLSYDLCASVACWVHHSWIAGFLMVASSAHFAISFISDSAGLCQPIVARILAHKSALLSSLSGCCLWLGFHTLAVYSHNDTVVAFGEPEKQILIEPTNAQIIQQSIGKAV
jgi:photosystem I P700 chlorophyll a apoprotein A2